MKLNLVFRTFNVDNLRYSLFLVPKYVELSPSNMVIYIHNDNPEANKKLDGIMKEFLQLYKEYEVRVIDEEVNQQMFMSSMRTCKELDSEYEWTMFCDDDDYPVINKELIDYIDKNCNKHAKVWTLSSFYDAGLNEELTDKNLKGFRPKSLPQFLRTDILKKISVDIPIIEDLLMKYNKSTKFSTGEDYLILSLYNAFEDIWMTTSYPDTLHANNHRPIKIVSQVIRESEHECNGYVSWRGTDNTKNFLIIDQIRKAYIYYLIHIK